MFEDLTWTCHVCQEERPDEFISVFKTHRTLPSGFQVQQNVRYCNDRSTCAAGAQTKNFLGNT